MRRWRLGALAVAAAAALGVAIAVVVVVSRADERESLGAAADDVVAAGIPGVIVRLREGDDVTALARGAASPDRGSASEASRRRSSPYSRSCSPTTA